MNRISKSLVGCYEFCPYKAKLWLDKVPPTDKKPHALERGNLIHDVFENFYKNISTEKVEKVFKESTAAGLYQYFLKTCSEIKSSALQDANEDIKNFCKWNVQKYLKNKDEFFPVYTEEKIYLEDEDIVGVIDRVDIEEDKVRIIDYKSGYGGEKSLSKFRFELSVYARLAEKSHGIKVNQWGVYFCGDNTLLIEDVNPSYFERWSQKKIGKLQHAIKTNEFPKTEWVAGCSNCEYFTHCWR